MACDPYRDDVEGDHQGKVHQVDLATLKREADVLSIHCNLTPETKGMVDREFLYGFLQAHRSDQHGPGPYL